MSKNINDLLSMIEEFSNINVNNLRDYSDINDDYFNLSKTIKNLFFKLINIEININRINNNNGIIGNNNDNDNDIYSNDNYFYNDVKFILNLNSEGRILYKKNLYDAKKELINEINSQLNIICINIEDKENVLYFNYKNEVFNYYNDLINEINNIIIQNKDNIFNGVEKYITNLNNTYNEIIENIISIDTKNENLLDKQMKLRLCPNDLNKYNYFVADLNKYIYFYGIYIKIISMLKIYRYTKNTNNIIENDKTINILNEYFKNNNDYKCKPKIINKLRIELKKIYFNKIIINQIDNLINLITNKFEDIKKKPPNYCEQLDGSLINNISKERINEFNERDKYKREKISELEKDTLYDYITHENYSRYFFNENKEVTINPEMYISDEIKKKINNLQIDKEKGVVNIYKDNNDDNKYYEFISLEKINERFADIDITEDIDLFTDFYNTLKKKISDKLNIYLIIENRVNDIKVNNIIEIFENIKNKINIHNDDNDKMKEIEKVKLELFNNIFFKELSDIIYFFHRQQTGGGKTYDDLFHQSTILYFENIDKYNVKEIIISELKKIKYTIISKIDINITKEDLEDRTMFEEVDKRKISLNKILNKIEEHNYSKYTIIDTRRTHYNGLDELFGYYSQLFNYFKYLNIHDKFDNKRNTDNKNDKIENIISKIIDGCITDELNEEVFYEQYIIEYQHCIYNVLLLIYNNINFKDEFFNIINPILIEIIEKNIDPILLNTMKFAINTIDNIKKKFLLFICTGFDNIQNPFYKIIINSLSIFTTQHITNLIKINSHNDKDKYNINDNEITMCYYLNYNILILKPYYQLLEPLKFFKEYIEDTTICNGKTVWGNFLKKIYTLIDLINKKTNNIEKTEIYILYFDLLINNKENIIRLLVNFGKFYIIKKYFNYDLKLYNIDFYFKQVVTTIISVKSSIESFTRYISPYFPHKILTDIIRFIGYLNHYLYYLFIAIEVLANNETSITNVITHHLSKLLNSDSIMSIRYMLFPLFKNIINYIYQTNFKINRDTINNAIKNKKFKLKTPEGGSKYNTNTKKYRKNCYNTNTKKYRKNCYNTNTKKYRKKLINRTKNK